MDKEEKLLKFLTIGIIFFGFMVSMGFIVTSMEQRNIDSLMSYCEKITGERKASFDNDNNFVGCETVVK